MNDKPKCSQCHKPLGETYFTPEKVNLVLQDAYCSVKCLLKGVGAKEYPTSDYNDGWPEIKLDGLTEL